MGRLERKLLLGTELLRHDDGVCGLPGIWYKSLCHTLVLFFRDRVCLAQTGLKLGVILLPLPPECWDNRQVPPHPACVTCFLHAGYIYVIMMTAPECYCLHRTVEDSEVWRVKRFGLTVMSVPNNLDFLYSRNCNKGGKSC